MSKGVGPAQTLKISLAELRSQQNQELAPMRAELAMLRELVAPQVAAVGELCFTTDVR